VTWRFFLDNLWLLAGQALAVALPGAGTPRWLMRLRGPVWSLVVPLSIPVVVGVIAVAPISADALAWLALIAVPPLAAIALAWAMRGGRWWLAPLAAVLLALAWTDQHHRAGELAGLALDVLSCVTLGRLLVAICPARLLEAGIVLMAIFDSILVFGNQLQAPNAVLIAAQPGPGLPQLQSVGVGVASLGYGDLFAAGLFGALVAARGRGTWRWGLVVLALALAWDLMFYVVDTIPATVPVAAALLILLADDARGRARAAPARA
jgi:hypothetical protein